MTNCKSNYAGLAGYNNGIAFKKWNTKSSKSIVSSIKDNLLNQRSDNNYYTLKNGYPSFPTNCTNITIPKKKHHGHHHHHDITTVPTPPSHPSPTPNKMCIKKNQSCDNSSTRTQCCEPLVCQNEPGNYGSLRCLPRQTNLPQQWVPPHMLNSRQFRENYGNRDTLKDLDVHVYTREGCPWCDKAKEQLEKEGQLKHVTLKDITKKDHQQEAQKLGLGQGVPSFFSMKTNKKAKGYHKSLDELVKKLS